jgi:hypothetical protein
MSSLWTRDRSNAPAPPAAGEPAGRIRGEAVHAVALALACLASYELTTHLLSGVHSVAASDDRLGGMWAAVATIFVYRGTFDASRSAAVSRILATLLSLALCLIYLALFAFHPWGLAVLIGLGSLSAAALGRPGDAITANITTAVVLVIAGVEPRNAWEQPILRLADTVIGAAVGVAVALVVRRLRGARARHT